MSTTIPFKKAEEKTLGWLLPLTLALLNIAIALFWPERPRQSTHIHQLFWVFLFANALIPWLLTRFEKHSLRRAGLDLANTLNIIVLAWQIIVGRTEWLAPYLFPSITRVFAALQADWRLLGEGVFSSFMLLGSGYALALVLGIPAGLVVGWYRRMSQAALPVAKVISPIPPNVYVPYAIALLPSFFASSVLVIFIGGFWPVFINTVQAVKSIDNRLIDSARTLCLKPFTFFRRILLPAAAPGIFTGAMLALVLSFIMLTIAEMIGAKAGLGWYIQYYADFAQYDRVIAGIIFVGLVVLAIVTGFDRIQHHILRWQGEREN